MALNVDQEILEDFLVEAGEILELLSEQLVDLEQNPKDRELLNAIFRGFHTVKGGAGFLQLEPMVDCCHSAENLFDMLRNDDLEVSAALMDVVLQALDTVNAMFEDVRGGENPEPAPADLIARLDALAAGQSIAVDAPAPAAAPAPEPAADLGAQFNEMVSGMSAAEEAPAAGESDLITEDEFESLLDDLHGSGAPGITPAASPQSDLITEDEFDSLMDELHGPTGAPGITPATPATSSMADSEFDQLLDQAVKQATATPAAAPAPAAEPVKAENPGFCPDCTG